MTTTPPAGGKLVYWIKECPLGAKHCKGPKWNKKRWGHTKDEAILRFKEHLYNKHKFTEPSAIETICECLEFETYIDEEDKVEEPAEPLAPPTS